MKTPYTNFKSINIGFILILLMAANLQLFSANYQTYYLDSLGYNDSIAYCTGTDSIELVKPNVVSEWSAWFLDRHADTLYSDNLLLPNGFDGIVYYQNYQGSYELKISPFRIYLVQDTAWNCGTTETIYVRTNYGGDGTLTYAWSPSEGLNDTTSSHPSVRITSNTSYYSVTVSAGDCQLIDTTHIDVIPFTTNTNGDIEIACGGTAQLQVTSNYNETAPHTYLWTPSVGLNDTTISNPITEVRTDTKYIVTISAEDCISKDSINVKVNPLSLNAGEDKTIVCGGTAQLNVTSNYTGDGTLVYSWSPTEGLNDSTISNPTATVTSEIKYTVSAPFEGCESANDEVLVSLRPMTRPNICIVGVDSTNKNMIIWDKPASSSIDSFYIYKETDVTNVYKKIKSVSYDDKSMFVDVSSNPHIQSNKYKISVLDVCGIESDKSRFHKTMHLSLNQGQNNVWNLIWESYKGFTVSTYKVYRGTNPADLQLIGTSSASNTQYSDFSAPSGYVYYQIEIISPHSCSPDKKSSSYLKATDYNVSRSNIVTNNPQGVNVTSTEARLIEIYPNPTNGILTITIDNPQGTKLEIYNLQGKMMYKKDMESIHETIDLSAYPKGMYLVKVNENGNVKVGKVVLE